MYASPGRAFRINWRGASAEATLAAVMEKANVDWEAARGDVAGGGGTQYVDWWLIDGHHPPDATDFKVFGGANLSDMWPDARTVVFDINTGAVEKLFYNPYHRQQVRAFPHPIIFQNESKIEYKSPDEAWGVITEAEIKHAKAMLDQATVRARVTHLCPP